MKKTLFVLFFICCFIYSFSQNADDIILNLADNAAKKLSHEIYGKRNQISKDTSNLIIYINLLKNSDGKISEFSEKMTKYMANKLNSKLTDKIEKNLRVFESVDVFFEKNNIITNYDKYRDFDLKWQFIINKNENKIKFYNIKLIFYKNIDSSYISINEFSIDYKTKIDDNYFKYSEYDYLRKIININFFLKQKKAAIMLKDTQNNDYFPKYSDGIFAYTNLDTTKKYYFNVNLQDSTYIYILFFDPNKPEFINLVYPFYKNENIPLKPGNNIICKDFPIIFGDLESDTSKVYLKFFLSEKKINIENFCQTVKIKKDVELKIIDKDDGKRFYKNLYRYKKIQTQQLYLIFKNSY